MGCQSCAQARAAKAAAYPREVTLPDGSVSTVTSAADERVQRQNAQARMRQDNARRVQRGYSAVRD